MDGKCAWLAYLMLIGHFFHRNRSTQLLSELYLLSFLKNHYLQTCIPFICLQILFHHWNLPGINVTPNPACLHSTSCSLQSGQFLFFTSCHQWLRSCLFSYIRIGNLILCQSFLSSSHWQTFLHMHTDRRGMIAFIQGCVNMHRWTFSGSAVSVFCGRSGGTWCNNLKSGKVHWKCLVWLASCQSLNEQTCIITNTIPFCMSLPGLVWQGKS